ncbi:uncharacterized protein LOC112162262 [Oryzias melastigma]|uniref:uncharacterized protein LOC112162262 n=1 Tax=Oryzias melastigma TaxID=30732 RepID=UPI000CF7C0BF|nr:uncharacterized protein LOC112162262 [Oryzias melastigma]
MENFLLGMLWFSVCVCLPLTVVVFLIVCLKARRGHVPIYYVNLLIANLIQLLCMIDFVVKYYGHQMGPFTSVFVHVSADMASLGFRMCIALERYFFIAFPQFEYIRQTKGSVLLCAAVWGVCVIMIPIPVVYEENLSIRLMAVLPAPVFIICLFETIRLLCQAAPFATSVPKEDKQRIVGTLIVLMLNYSLLTFPIAIIGILMIYFRVLFFLFEGIIWLHYFSSFMDLILFVLTLKGPIDKLLGCLCPCVNDYPVVHPSAPISV